jgi:predicted NAD/FAD-binding protein
VARAGRERAAVVGSGISGLTAAYVLQRRYDVTLYESADHLGGHTDTHDVVTPDAGTVPIDTGFIVHNQRTYPLLCQLFSELDVATRSTEMSMSIRCEGCGLEYAGAKGIGGLFAQPRSLANPAFLRLLAQVPRFFRQARTVAAGGDDDTSLGEFLAQGGYSAYFSSHFVIPIVSCVWSVAPGTALQYPARYLFTFLDNHGMLTLGGSPTWRTVVGGARTYVDRVVKDLSAVATSTPVRAVIRQSEGVEVRTDDDEGVSFDRVVMATHADTSLALLAHPSALQRSVLGAFEYSRNETWLHTDATLLPNAGRARSAWNFLMPSCTSLSGHAVVSYDMNRLQGVTSSRQHVVTLNDTDRIDPGRVLDRMTYEHPIFTRASLAAQGHLSQLSDTRLAFAGAYHGWGFHEDGCRSGMAAAQSLGVRW